jgi:NADH-quinone oxidoreductase subunit H
MAAVQRRKGPNIVGKGLLQPLADAIKALLKTNMKPFQSNRVLFVLAPIMVLFFSLLFWGFIPYCRQKIFITTEYGVLYVYIISSMIVFGVILAG